MIFGIADLTRPQLPKCNNHLLVSFINGLFAINFSATQELDRQLQVEKAKNQALEARLLAVEEKLNVA